MGRVYATEPAAGELPLAGCRVEALDPDGPHLPRVVRVEFDAQADEGPATVHADAPDTSGRLAPGPVPTRRVTLRAAVRVVPLRPAAAATPADQPAARKLKKAPQVAFDAPAQPATPEA